MDSPPQTFWNIPVVELLQQLQTTLQGLTENEARRRFAHYGPSLLKTRKRYDLLTLLLSQFKSPIILILLFAAGLSLFLHDPADAIIILMIVFISGLLGFWQERGAADAVEKLLAIINFPDCWSNAHFPLHLPWKDIWI